jgi:phage portal protein BeeE
VKSGLRKLAGQQSRPPVPMDQGTRMLHSFYGLGREGIETYLRAYGEVGTLHAIVRLNSRSVAKVDWKLFRKQPRDGRVRYTTSDAGSDQRTEVVQHQALAVLSKPNDFWTRMGLFSLSQTYKDLCGESWWVVTGMDTAGFPLGLWSVRPDRMEPIPSPDAYLQGYVYHGPNGEQVPLNVNEVILNKDPNPLDPQRGMGAAQTIMADLQSLKLGAQWNRNWFLNSAEPGGVIEFDRTLDDTEWDEFTARWRETHQGVNRAGHVAVLENAKWVPNQMSMRDMDFANLRGTSRDIVREAYATHKVMLGVSDDVNRANAQTGEEVQSAWQTVPRLDDWKDCLNFQYLPLFGQTGQGVEFDYVYPRVQNREQDNAELTAKANAAAVLLALGVFEPSAVLEVVGLPDMPLAEVQAAATVTRPPPGGAAGGADPAEQDMTAALRKMRANGHQPVGSLR